MKRLLMFGVICNFQSVVQYSCFLSQRLIIKLSIRIHFFFLQYMKMIPITVLWLVYIFYLVWLLKLYSAHHFLSIKENSKSSVNGTRKNSKLLQYWREIQVKYSTAPLIWSLHYISNVIIICNLMIKSIYIIANMNSWRRTKYVLI